MNNKDLDKALMWVDQALAIAEDGWLYAQKVDIIDKMNNISELNKTAAQGIAYLKSTKPEAWEELVKYFEDRLQRK